MRLNLDSLKDKNSWAAAGIALPGYDAAAVAEGTRREPIWVHFGAGNIFRGFIGSLQQQLINEGLSGKGIIAVETFDYDIIEKIYKPNDNLVMNVTLGADGKMDFEILASIVEAIAVRGEKEDMARLEEIFSCPALQIISFTITEKGYALRGPDGDLIAVAKDDIQNGPENPRHAMSITTAMLYKRYQAGKLPVALLSMDNCSKNGEKLQQSVLEIAEGWRDKGFVDPGFISYLRDESIVSFPWSMVDKITPRPDNAVWEKLDKKGVIGMEPLQTSKQTFIAPFVNAERPQYLVVEDKFPNCRPPLERSGVYMTDRVTVNKTEGMKVTACLNPLHTAMSVFGCLLGYTKICDEMRDKDIVALIRRLGYVEGLPVVVDPCIISPIRFLDEVIDERLPNPFLPDAPQRIVTDTSQKVGIRFGETIKSYINGNGNLGELVAIPLAIAGWMRYLLGTDDKGQPMDISPDPMKDELQAKLSGVVWNEPASYKGQLIPILSNSNIFGLDLTQTELSGRIEEYFVSMLEGSGSVRKVLGKL